jgi:hypothetical protein
MPFSVFWHIRWVFRKSLFWVGSSTPFGVRLMLARLWRDRIHTEQFQEALEILIAIKAVLAHSRPPKILSNSGSSPVKTNTNTINSRMKIASRQAARNNRSNTDLPPFAAEV